MATKDGELNLVDTAAIELVEMTGDVLEVQVRKEYIGVGVQVTMDINPDRTVDLPNEDHQDDSGRKGDQQVMIQEENIENDQERGQGKDRFPGAVRTIDELSLLVLMIHHTKFNKTTQFIAEVRLLLYHALFFKVF
eukprot:TRINITY_DN3234_c0_g1_i7.p4 TRINITY_DN3234_c0_g1~~TRINITY_DN3234_c0_g1_i7.p4  ORF type:complete len:136 (-),score=16.86 TRINITY_DN3234_c0_g1_i7:338-745(-)